MDASFHQLRTPGWARHEHVTYSPNGHSIAFIARGVSSSRRLVRGAVGGPFHAVTEDGADVDGYAWLPDNTGFLVSYHRTEADVQPRSPTDDVAIIQEDGVIARRLSTLPLGRYRAMAVSAAGNFAVLARTPKGGPLDATTLLRIDLARDSTSELRTESLGVVKNLVFRDDSTLLITAGRPVEQTGKPNGYIALLDMRALTLDRLSSTDEVVAHGVVRPAYPGLIIYASFHPDDREGRAIWVLDLQRQSRELVSTRAVGDLDLHPGGCAIVVETVAAEVGSASVIAELRLRRCLSRRRS